ncbi:hypothetical protein QMK19_31140 [Streptomyces sp. H10-C2]|uniref:hypothetical protein n=1 Tax=unclassified Streptomyces TaxID=2593676 RepID=UPI0024BBB5C8|nr:MULTISPECIES: hypothetical protein [unclassified Streptomyces]MDJ0345073.1 hypothetical protein [Streptomyces sp. PH10-H1]MDJ0373978.1 hypothetical protein [Streptomyces sp. H10-C2]
MLSFAFEQFVTWKYGAAWAIVFGLFAIDRKNRGTTYTCIALAGLAVLLAQ